MYKEEYPVGSKIRIADFEALEVFKANWKSHHPLEAEQLKYAGQIAIVKEVSFYFGGDELYLLNDIPGIWHEKNLEPINSNAWQFAAGQRPFRP